MSNQNNVMNASDWCDIYPNQYKEALLRAGIYPKKCIDCDIIPEEISDPNLKYTDYNYQLKPGDKLTCMGEEIPMEELGLFAIQERRWFMQPAVHWVYKHFITDEMFEIIADYETYVDDEDKILYGNIYDINTRKITDQEILEDRSYLLLHDKYNIAKRKFKISTIV